MKRYLKNQRGVTLIELLGVIVILGILAAIAVPAVLNQIDEAEEATYEANVVIVEDAAERYFIIDNSSDPVTLDELVTAGFLKAIPKGFEGVDTVSRDGGLDTTPTP